MKVCVVVPFILWLLGTPGVEILSIQGSYGVGWNDVNQNVILSFSKRNSHECVESSQANSTYCESLSNGFYEYPYNCSAYITCYDSCADLEYCPDGKLFNSPLQICDTPGAVDCEPLPYPTPSPTESPPENPCLGIRNNTLLPSAENCNEFYLCVNDQSKVYRCPSEMLFNPDLNICDDKDNVLCYGDRTTPGPLDTTTPAEESFTKCEDQEQGTFFPDPESCQQYYYCWGNNSYTILPCPVDNWFNPISGNCGPDIDPDACRENAPTSTPTIATSTSTTAAQTSPEDNAGNPCADQQLGASFPIKSDCQSYLLCLNNGESTTAKCPSNAWFDPKTGDCGPNVSPTACLESFETTTTAATTQAPKDPCADQELGTSYPLVTNCQQYILCMGNGESTIANCIYNSWFDPQTGNCGPDVSPTACKESGVTTASSTPTSQATSPLTTPSPTWPTLPTASTEETTTNPPDILDICSGKSDGYYATYPEVCKKYILCASPVPIAFYCPESLFFNEALQRCVEWESSDCSNGETTTSSPGHTTPSPDTHICSNSTGLNLPYRENCQWYIYCTDENSFMMGICGNEEYFDPWTGKCGFDVSPEACREIQTTSPTVTDSTEGPTTVITPTTPDSQPDPCDGAPEGKLVPYPDDCSKFIQCIQPDPIVYDCREGQEFSAALERCMAPWFANCSIPATTIPPVTIPTTTTTTEKPSPNGICADKPEGSLVPYPGNCSKYIACEDPIPVGYACPEGEEFNPTILTCTDPHMAGCNPSALHTSPKFKSDNLGFSLWQSLNAIASFVTEL
ncbi:chitin-binding domain protein cbd-1 [Drosophila mauritiana]|uniref:Chitin-binding domain protein cbd-1 n=1 Tax=Drosophila mauritiana TaxID=7226 RepID=A0A6P8JYE4_DROMA|nr:chitin-binding domain protein cbd-1 [Drosophila mauritiana]